jgi:hypothetical protein
MKPPSNERLPTTWASTDKKPEADHLSDTRKPLKEDDPRRLLTSALPVRAADLPIKDQISLSSVIVSATVTASEGKPLNQASAP